jgi:hypothetical protein
LIRGLPGARFELRVSHRAGRIYLPIVALRRVA